MSANALAAAEPPGTCTAVATDWYTFRLRCELPATVSIGQRQWRIDLAYWDKGRRAALFAESGDRRGNFVSGRTRTVEASLVGGISVPVGSVRDALVRALVLQGGAEIVRA